MKVAVCVSELTVVTCVLVCVTELGISSFSGVCVGIRSLTLTELEHDGWHT